MPHLVCPRASKDIASRIGCSLPDFIYVVVRTAGSRSASLPGRTPRRNKLGQGQGSRCTIESQPRDAKAFRLWKADWHDQKADFQHQKGKLAFEKKEVDKLSAALLRFTLALEKSSSPADASVADIE